MPEKNGNATKHPRPRPPRGPRYEDVIEAARQRESDARSSYGGRLPTADEQFGERDPDDD